eukprot:gene7895-9412_t
MTEMTKPNLKKLCKDQGLYTTPSINDKLYLHYKGFKEIANLDEYTGLKALWLEGNGLFKIQGLEHQKDLRTLYLHENIIEKIENLENQTELDNINLSKNYIRKIENLAHMTKLTSLNLANNAISTLDGVSHVLEIPSLQTIDLQHNKIEDPAIVDIVAQLPDLRVLYLMGNPVVKHIRNYRKTIVSRCKQLKYLDERPVFEEERRRTDAWARVVEAGGTPEEALEAERTELKVIRAEKDAADEANFKAFEMMMREGKEIRRLREAEERAQQGLPPLEVTSSASSTSSSDESKGSASEIEEVVEVEPGINPFSGERIIPVPESESVRLAREARWGPNSVPFSERYAAQVGDKSAEDANEISAEEAQQRLESVTSNAELWKDVYSATASVASVETTAPSVLPVVAPVDSVAAQDANLEGTPAPEVKKASKFMSLLSEAQQEVAAQPVPEIAVSEVDMEELD